MTRIEKLLAEVQAEEQARDLGGFTDRKTQVLVILDDGATALDVEYAVPGAFWKPACDLAFDPDHGQVSRERLMNRPQRLNAGLSGVARNAAATVSVRCEGDASPTVRLAYVVPAARWSPEYDLRFMAPAKQKVGDGQAVLTVASVISQSTGEDWNDVEVWLSTAKPKLGGEAPLPQAIHVRGAPEDKQKTLVQAQEVRAKDLKAGKASASSAAGAELEDGGKAFVLKLPARVTVRADGRPYWFPVDDLKTKARSSLVAVPALSPYAYQVASWSNPAAAAGGHGPRVSRQHLRRRRGP